MLLNFCIEHGDLTSDHVSNRRLSPGEVMDVLALGSTNQKNFEGNKKSQALKGRKALTAKCGRKRKILYQFKYNIRSCFHFTFELKYMVYIITLLQM